MNIGRNQSSWMKAGGRGGEGGGLIDELHVLLSYPAICRRPEATDIYVVSFIHLFKSIYRRHNRMKAHRKE